VKKNGKMRKKANLKIEPMMEGIVYFN